MNILKSFIITIRRFKTSVLINVVGLTVAIAAFFIIMTKVAFDNGYESQNPRADRVYRATLNAWNNTYAIFSEEMIKEISEISPYIKTFTYYMPMMTDCKVKNSNGTELIYREKMSEADSGLISILGLNILEGNPDVLKQQDELLIPQSIAHKMFNGQNAVGNFINDKRVGAVYEDRPVNILYGNIIYYHPKKMLYDGRGLNYAMLFELDDPKHKEDVEKAFNDVFLELAAQMRDTATVELTLLKDVYYSSESEFDFCIKGDRNKSNIMMVIAILVIVIAIVNYINFASALTPLRIKMINIQKVIGANVWRLRLNLLVESVLIALIAYVLALLLILWVGNALFQSTLEIDVSPAANLGLTLKMAALTIAIGIVAGLYPVYYMTSFPPIMALKSSFGMSPKGRRYRSLLISIQFVISIFLMIYTCFLNMQNAYMGKYNLGFEKDQVIYTEVTRDIYEHHERTLCDRLISYNDIDDVAFSFQQFGSNNDIMFMNYQNSIKEDYKYHCLIVSPTFLHTLGIKVEEGSDFNAESEKLDQQTVIFNQQSKQMDPEILKVGISSRSIYNSARIVGFVSSDLHYSSLHQSDVPLCFVVLRNIDRQNIINQGGGLTHMYIRVKAGTRLNDAIAHVKASFLSVAPNFTPEFQFLDNVINKAYKEENRTAYLITSFSILAILISLMGVFGLVLFETQYRRREIGIRRVHGASVGEILGMINRKFVYIVLTCFVVAVPVSYYAVDKWLQSFVERVDISWWVFAAVLLLMWLITIITVTVQSLRAATENPSHSIKSE